MENFLMDARSVITVVSFITFLGIIFWACSGRRKADFDEAANLPFADEPDEQESNKAEMVSNHG